MRSLPLALAMTLAFAALAGAQATDPKTEGVVAPGVPPTPKVPLRGREVISASRPPARVFEMRTYTPAPGKAEAMNKRFREHTCGLFRKHGMELVGFWTPIDEKDNKEKLVYILSYPSREAAASSWKAFNEDPEWKKAKAESEKDGPVVAKAESVYLSPTDYSPIK